MKHPARAIDADEVRILISKKKTKFGEHPQVTKALEELDAELGNLPQISPPPTDWGDNLPM